MEKQRAFTLSQIAQHMSKQSCWLVIGHRVLDVTKFLEEHPRGEEVLLESSGKDATNNFKYIGHNNLARNLLLKYQIGVDCCHHHIQEDDSGDAPPYKEPEPNEQMEAFVIKEEPKDTDPKYAAFLEFLLPILVAV